MAEVATPSRLAEVAASSGLAEAAQDLGLRIEFSEDDLGVGVALHVDPKLLVDGSKLLRGRRKSGV